MRTWLRLALIASSGVYGSVALQMPRVHTSFSLASLTAREHVRDKGPSPRGRDYTKAPPRRCAGVDAAKNQCLKNAVEPTDYCHEHAQRPRRVQPKPPQRRSSASTGCSRLITAQTGKLGKLMWGLL
jgi:hypothetical protein